MNDLEAAITSVCRRAQVLTSVEAELGATPPRWIFEAPTFAAGAGEYILIHRKDWDQFKMDLRMAFGPTTPDVVGCTNADQPDGAA